MKAGCYGAVCKLRVIEIAENGLVIRPLHGQRMMRTTPRFRLFRMASGANCFADIIGRRCSLGIVWHTRMSCVPAPQEHACRNGCDHTNEQENVDTMDASGLPSRPSSWSLACSLPLSPISFLRLLQPKVFDSRCDRAGTLRWVSCHRVKKSSPGCGIFEEFPRVCSYLRLPPPPPPQPPPPPPLCPQPPLERCSE